VPAAVGVPLTVQPVNVRPAGSAPAVTEQVYGAVPPVTPITWLYGVPTEPFGRLVRDRESPDEIVMLTGPVVLSCGVDASVTCTVRPAVPAVVGVPLTVQPVSVRPAGSVPAVTEQTYGAVPPVTPITWLYGVPTEPFGRLDRVRVNPAGLMVIVTGPVAVCCGLELSVTVTVAVVGPPGVVGVPVTVHPVNVSPAGRAPPVIEQV